MENVDRLPGECMASASKFLHDFHNVVSSRPLAAPSPPRWIPPRPDEIKGVCRAWRKAFFTHIKDPEHGEALAARLAVELCLHYGWGTCVIEGDCLQVIQKIRSTELDSYLVSPIIHDIRSLIPARGSFSFCFTRRLANTAAHHLSRLVIPT
ncbi:hypothetical protein Salat_1104500 [Sesamum alatum]|uniref:RNase H type-1 domain-containing protein n=1 Tax=Sesamum alatum TaxID=300844 RepID=A0AAE1YNQ8_9LAMI|nr:hypothetical protein Salat_1104500 [Sesamum alatum]